MKKYIGLMALGLMCAQPALATTVTAWDADNCDAKGGVRRTVGGTVFCVSTKNTNWWTAYAWCQALGGRMASIQELCSISAVFEGA